MIALLPKSRKVQGWSKWSGSAAGNQWISTVPTQAAMVVETG
jgi:hypothetical protein